MSFFSRREAQDFRGFRRDRDPVLYGQNLPCPVPIENSRAPVLKSARLQAFATRNGIFHFQVGHVLIHLVPCCSGYRSSAIHRSDRIEEGTPHSAILDATTPLRRYLRHSYLPAERRPSHRCHGGGSRRTFGISRPGRPSYAEEQPTGKGPWSRAANMSLVPVSNIASLIAGAVSRVGTLHNLHLCTQQQ